LNVEEIEERELDLLTGICFSIANQILDDESVQAKFRACSKYLCSQEFFDLEVLSDKDANQLKFTIPLWVFFKSKDAASFPAELIKKVLKMKDTDR